MRHLRTFALVSAVLASCKGCDEPATGGTDAAVRAPPEAGVGPRHGEAGAATANDAGPLHDAASDAPVADEPFGDAGTSVCRLVYGPAEQPFRGPAALSIHGQELQMVANDAGKPHVYPVSIAPPPPKGAPAYVPPRPATFAGMRWPPCELAGRYAYCQAPGGAVVRSVVGATEPGKEIAKSRSGTRIAAVSLGGDHSAVAFLQSRQTTEGEMLQAFVALDDREPVRLSEEGAGATTMSLIPRGDQATAVYLDTRTSMVPVHARPVTLKGADLALGADAVVFVGGAPERGIDFAAAAAGKNAFAFVPMPRDITEFGMAALPIPEAPKDSVPAVWSLYPNGLDPAPIAAAAARDGKTTWVARVRPREKAVGSPRILELGRVDATGSFESYGEIAPGPVPIAKNKLSVTDIALAEDASGGIWILYGDTSSTWLERRLCP